MIVGDEFDFISGVIASDVVFDDVLNNAFISFVCAGELVPVEHLVFYRTSSNTTSDAITPLIKSNSSPTILVTLSPHSSPKTTKALPPPL